MKVRIDELDMSLQTRCGTDAETVNNYAEAMADGAEFPEVTVFTDGVHKWLADGFHRVMAARQNGRTAVSADVRKGTEDDAVVFGGTANNRQGKRPTRADVQHFLSMVWERREAIFGWTPTGGNLAERCGVSRRTGELFVRERLAEMPKTPVSPAQIAQVKMPVRPTRLIGADGKTYPVRPSAPVRPVRPERRSSEIEDWPRDRYGVQIPQEILAVFGESPLPDVLSCISRARSSLRNGFRGNDPAFAAVRQDALVNLDNAYNFVGAAGPHCVCRMCQGNGCRACHSRGWQTEEEYGRNPREFRAEGGAE